MAFIWHQDLVLFPRRHVYMHSKADKSQHGTNNGKVRKARKTGAQFTKKS